MTLRRGTPEGNGPQPMPGDFQALLSDVEETLARLRHEIERLQHLILTDELTGLYNRRYLEVRLEEELNRARRFSRPFSLLFLDLDDFKAVNERYGHPAGDQLLAEFGQVLRENARAMDVVFRYGGEEFLLLLPETGLEDALEVGQRLQRQVGHRSFLEGCLAITFSGGVASFPVDGTDGKTLVERADVALRAAKARGKNRIMAATRLEAGMEEVAASRQEPRRPPSGPPVARLPAVPGFRQGNLLPASFWSGNQLFRVRALVAQEPAGSPEAERYQFQTDRGLQRFERRNGQWYWLPERPLEAATGLDTAGKLSVEYPYPVESVRGEDGEE